MGQLVMRMLMVDANPLMRRAITSVKWVPGLDVVLEHIEAATQADGLRALAEHPHAAIIDAVLGEPGDRRGMGVVWAAHARGIPLLVHTAERLEDSIQRDLADAKPPIPLLTKSVDPIVLNDMAVRRALNRDERIDTPLDTLVRIARHLRALPGRVSENMMQAVALALVAAIADFGGNKTAGSRSLGEDRHFADRTLIWLPRRPISQTRPVNGSAEVSLPPEWRKANERT